MNCRSPSPGDAAGSGQNQSPARQIPEHQQAHSRRQWRVAAPTMQGNGRRLPHARPEAARATRLLCHHRCNACVTWETGRVLRPLCGAAVHSQDWRVDEALGKRQDGAVLPAQVTPLEAGKINRQRDKFLNINRLIPAGNGA